jgi:predicted small secreted protein
MKALFACALLAVLAACNTMEGLGQDVQKGGENLERAAEDNK